MIVVDGDAIADYVASKLRINISPPFQAIGFLTDDKRPMSAFIFNDYSDSNIELTVFAEPGGISRGVLRYVARYVFVKNNCRRLTVRTKKRNKRVLQLAPRYGFKYEGVAKHFYADDDAVVFRMLKSDCIWL